MTRDIYMDYILESSIPFISLPNAGLSGVLLPEIATMVCKAVYPDGQSADRRDANHRSANLSRDWQVA